MLSSVADKIVNLTRYKEEVDDELTAILSWWMCNMPDEQGDGFFGSVNNENIPTPLAAKGIVLNSRILWAFSAAYQFSNNLLHLQTAQRAFEYIISHFSDDEYGGVYWSVDEKGKMLDGKKQIYGQAFCIYGMVEYYKITKDSKVLHFAQDLYKHIEKYSSDKIKGGYVEAFSREWTVIDDLRLSEKDDNEKKTMNTHLHIIEAYANLFLVWPDKVLQEKIVVLLALFDKYIINKGNYHLHLFMDDEWNVKSTLQSFGHDIEAAWLLLECAEISGYQIYIDKYKTLSVKLAIAAAEGLDEDGGLWYEYEPANSNWIREKHSWPQAEAMVGFFNAFQLSGERKYLTRSYQSFEFIKKNIKNNHNGEWYWGIYEDRTVMQKEKAGFWKCPYHSTRACIEIHKRILNSIK